MKPKPKAKSQKPSEATAGSHKPIQTRKHRFSMMEKRLVRTPVAKSFNSSCSSMRGNPRVNVWRSCNHKPKARSQKPRAKWNQNQKPQTKKTTNQSTKTKNQKPEAKRQKPNETKWSQVQWNQNLWNYCVFSFTCGINYNGVMNPTPLEIARFHFLGTVSPAFIFFVFFCRNACMLKKIIATCLKPALGFKGCIYCWKHR